MNESIICVGREPFFRIRASIRIKAFLAINTFVRRSFGVVSIFIHWLRFIQGPRLFESDFNLPYVAWEAWESTSGCFTRARKCSWTHLEEKRERMGCVSQMSGSGGYQRSNPVQHALHYRQHVKAKYFMHFAKHNKLISNEIMRFHSGTRCCLAQPPQIADIWLELIFWFSLAGPDFELQVKRTSLKTVFTKH